VAKVGEARSKKGELVALLFAIDSSGFAMNTRSAHTNLTEIL
jgi:hypothetical protein